MSELVVDPLRKYLDATLDHMWLKGGREGLKVIPEGYAIYLKMLLTKKSNHRAENLGLNHALLRTLHNDFNQGISILFSIVVCRFRMLFFC